MKLTQEQVDFILNNGEIIFSTVSADGKPRAIMVIPSLVEADRIVLADVQMEASLANVRANPNVFILSVSKALDRWLKLDGVAKYYSAGGGILSKVREIEAERAPEITVKGVIEVKIASAVSGTES